MNNESNCHQPSTLTVDSLSYKELQGLAMSLSLPGKMKQGVLVEAIKARQNHNEQAVAMILEANRQRRILKREQQLRHQQQQLLKFKDVDNKRKCLARPKTKRSASEMEMDPTFIVDPETFKRSKLAAALIQQTRQSRGPAFSFTALTTGATSLTIRKEHTHVSTPNMGGCSSWDQAIMAESVVPLPSQSMPVIPKTLPDLSKELSILPVLSDCSAVTSSSTNNEDLCCSVGSVSSGATSTSSWQSGSSGENHQPLPQSSFEDCDSAWIGADESYDLNTWKNMHNSKSNSNSYENVAPPPNSSAAYFEATAAAAPDIFINNGDIYSPDDFIANSSASGANYSAQDCQLSLESSSTSFQDVKPDPSTWSESVIQPSHAFQQPQQQPQFQQQQSNGVCTVSTESRVTNGGGCCYDFDCHKLGGPFFRIQRPGNSTPLFVPSGRSLTLSTFCNMLPRVASFVQ